MIDCHTHWGRAWAERNPADPSNWLAILDQYNVRHAVVLPEVGLIHAGKLASGNDELAQVCTRSQGRMIPFCTVNAWFREEAIGELQRCLSTLRFRGVKFHNWLQGFSVNHPVLDEVCDIAAAFNAPILFHDGTPPFTLPSQIALLAKRHPKTMFVLGHCGLLEHWRESAEALISTPNLWGCLCGPHVAAMRFIVQRCGASRLVWGSDFGYTLADCYPYRLQIIDMLEIRHTERDALFSTNARNLLQIAPARDL